MSSGKILAIVLLLAAVVAGFLLWRGDDIVVTPPGGGQPRAEEPAQPGKPLLPDRNDIAATSQPNHEDHQRTALIVDNSGKSYPQGVLGQVVDPQGYPLPDCEVYLMISSSGEEILGLMQQSQQNGRRFPPEAQAKTDENGRFQLGIAKLQAKRLYDLWVLHPRHSDYRRNRLDLLPNSKYDAGRIQMQRGVTLLGRVVAQGHNEPIASAVVTVAPGGGQLEIAPPPGRQQGLAATVDASGNYRFDNIDPNGIYKISALAPGHATVEMNDRTLDKNGENRVDFELPIGHKIAGIVTNSQGKGLDRARVTVFALSQKNPQTVETRTQSDGRFTIDGLHQGAFTVVALADGYVEGKVQPIESGKLDVQLTLEVQGQVDVQVIGKTGRPLDTYELVLKTFVPGANGGEDFYGKDVGRKSVRGARDGKASMTGIDPMDYVLEVHAAGHAKAFSEPFKIVGGAVQTVPSLVVRLNEGGIITGTVVDARGQPVVGASIQTWPKGYVDNPLTRIFSVPFRITKSTARSNTKGVFTLPLLNDGAYQLSITHDGFCNHIIPECQVSVGNTSQLGQIRLDRGAAVSGTARVDGRTKGQIKVTVASVGQANLLPVAFDAITDNDGKFTISKRLPPGDYEARAAEQHQGNPFITMFQMQKSKIDFTISRGQETYTLNINIESIKEDQ